LVGGFLCLFGSWQPTAEGKDSKREQFGPFQQVARRHAHAEARTMPALVQRVSGLIEPSRGSSLYFLRTFPLFNFSTYFGASP
jgi:hypothetical protein